ncbi:MAG: hypothetical protein ACREIA_10150 [Opitutaceae bacterium]
MSQDSEHLRLLSLFHTIIAIIIGLCSLLPVIHLVMGVAIIIAPEEFSSKGDGAPPAFVGWLFAGFAVAFILAGLALATATFIAGRCIKARKRYIFCIVVAAFDCLVMPFGTVLGVFTIIVLMRESVKRLFDTSTET